MLVMQVSCFVLPRSGMAVRRARTSAVDSANLAKWSVCWTKISVSASRGVYCTNHSMPWNYRSDHLKFAHTWQNTVRRLSILDAVSGPSSPLLLRIVASVTPAFGPEFSRKQQ